MPLHLMPLEEWEKVIDVDLNSVFYCLQAQLKILLPQGGGSIVNVASMAGKRVSLWEPLLFYQTWSIGINQNSSPRVWRAKYPCQRCMPTFLETDIIKTVPDNLLDFFTNFRVPLKRLGKAEEAAETILWLLSDKASYVNGHSLVLDGGMQVG